MKSRSLSARTGFTVNRYVITQEFGESFLFAVFVSSFGGWQEAMLKTELREMERKQKREGVDMTYLKNVILKLLETGKKRKLSCEDIKSCWCREKHNMWCLPGEVEALLPVVGMLLQFSPEEVKILGFCLIFNVLVHTLKKKKN